MNVRSAYSSSRASSALRREQPLTWQPAIAAVCTSYLVLYMMLFSSLRVLPALGLGLAVLAAIGLILAEGRIYGLTLIPLLLLSVVYVILSFDHALPSAWTRYYMPSMILRQWMWVPLLLIFSSAFATIFRLYLPYIVRNAWTLAALAFCVGRVSLYLSPREFDLFSVMTVYTFIPENAIFITFLAIAFFYRIGPAFWKAAFLSPAAIIFSSAQSFAGYLILLFIWISRRPGIVVVGSIAGVVLCMAFFPYNIRFLYTIDPNAGFRAVLWRHAIDAILDSYLLGVGFGTEYFKNDFSIGGRYAWKVTFHYITDRMVIGTHNSVFDVGLRMGLGGIMLFLTWVVSLGRICFDFTAPEYRPNCFFFVLLVLNNGFNIGVASMNFIFCTAVCAGWLLNSAAVQSRLLATRSP